MFSKIAIPATVLSFIVDKTADFLVDRLSKRVDDYRESKSFNLSEFSFEREFRNDLDNLSRSIQNLEAVAYQGKQLYEHSLNEIIRILNNTPTTNIYFSGNATLTINILCTPEGLRNREIIEVLPAQAINAIVQKNAIQLFEPINYQNSSSPNKDIANKFANIISRRKKELQKLREEDNDES